MGRAGAERRKEGSGRGWSSRACPARPRRPRRPLQPRALAAGRTPESRGAASPAAREQAPHSRQRGGRAGTAPADFGNDARALRGAAGHSAGLTPSRRVADPGRLQGAQLWDAAQPEQKLRKQHVLPELRGNACNSTPGAWWEARLSGWKLRNALCLDSFSRGVFCPR